MRARRQQVPFESGFDAGEEDPLRGAVGREVREAAAASFGFRFDWLDGDGVAGPELAATFASLEVRVGAVTVTRFLDRTDGSVSDRIHVPLYPLAASLTENWWFYGGESRSPTDSERHEFRQRHSLVSGGDGFVFPDLIIMPTGKRLRLQWFRSTPERPRFSPTKYLEQGEDRGDLPVFRQECARLVEAVLRRLEAAGIRDDHLRDGWAAIRDADPEEVAFCEAAASYGWYPYDLDDEQCATVLGLSNSGLSAPRDPAGETLRGPQRPLSRGDG